MAVYCKSCGEELLGAVNRCWRCGQEVVVQQEAAASEIASSEVSGELTGDEDLVPAQAVPAKDPATGPSLPPRQSNADAPIRRGSPFVDGYQPTESKASGGGSQRPASRRPGSAAATGSAFGALLLGVISLISLRITAIGAVVTAIFGIGFGIWGLYCPQRAAAITGLVLCCAALAIGGFLCAIILFEHLYGYSPFHPDPSLEDLLDEEPDGFGEAGHRWITAALSNLRPTGESPLAF